MQTKNPCNGNISQEEEKLILSNTRVQKAQYHFKMPEVVDFTDALVDICSM